LTKRHLTETSFDQAPFDRYFTEGSHLTERNFYRKVISPKKLENGHLSETQN
jgi:hypothetical protein